MKKNYSNETKMDEQQYTRWYGITFIILLASLLIFVLLIIPLGFFLTIGNTQEFENYFEVANLVSTAITFCTFFAFIFYGRKHHRNNPKKIMILSMLFWPFVLLLLATFFGLLF